MQDQLFDRDYQDARATLNGDLARLVASIAKGLASLHRRNWSAPWHGSRHPAASR